MDISVILPIYNAQSFLEESVSRMGAFLSENFHSYEIILIDDGSNDESWKCIEALTTDSLVRLRLPENQGKGAAVRRGVAVAQGSCIAFTDIDLPYDLKALTYAHQLICHQGFHLVVGDRCLPGSNYFELLSRSRYFATKVFMTAIRLCITGEIYDTQCGFKAFDKQCAKLLFEMIRTSGFAFDVELFYLALKYNLAIRKIPVRFQRSEETSVRLMSDSWGMLRDVSKMPIRWRQGVYHSEALRSLSSQRYWEE